MNHTQKLDAQKWRKELSLLSNNQLIETFNRETQKKGWVSSRGIFLSLLGDEIRSRNFDSNIIFEKNIIQTYSMKINKPIRLVDNKIEFLPSKS